MPSAIAPISLRVAIRLLILLAAVLCVNGDAARTADPAAGAGVPAATDFSARDVGQYGAIPWGSADEIIVPGSYQDRVRDLNLSVASVNLSGGISDEELDDWAEIANWGWEQNQVLLLRLNFWNGEDRYQGPMEETEVYWSRLDEFLAGLQSREGLAGCWGVVLAEENVAYAGRPEVLTELYQRIKSKYDLAVWQWWSPTAAVPDSAGWIPADGWVVNPYLMPNPAFRQYVRKYVASGSPVVVMPWATAQLGAFPPLTDEQWQINNDQLNVAVEFNLPVAFYWTFGTDASGTSCYFGCDRNNPPSDEIGKINQWVWDHIDRVRSLPADYTGQTTADSATVDPAGIALTDQNGTLAYQDDFSTQRCIDDAAMTGFRDLVMDGQALSARGFRGRNTNATLTYHFVGATTLKSPRVELTANLAKDLNGRVEIGLSKDGKIWRQSAAARKNGQQSLSFSSNAVENVQEFWVRIHLMGNAGSIGAYPVSIDDLRISSKAAKPRKR